MIGLSQACYEIRQEHHYKDASDQLAACSLFDFFSGTALYCHIVQSG